MSNPNGRFGVHGGQYVPETLMNAIIELEEAYNYYKANPDFQNELTQLFERLRGPSLASLLRGEDDKRTSAAQRST